MLVRAALPTVAPRRSSQRPANSSIPGVPPWSAGPTPNRQPGAQRSRHQQPVRAVLHHQTRGNRDRPHAVPADRRGPRWNVALANRRDVRGSVATVRLPLRGPRS